VQRPRTADRKKLTRRFAANTANGAGLDQTAEACHQHVRPVQFIDVRAEPELAGVNGWCYLLAGEAGGLVLSELIPEAAPVGGLAMPEEPEEGVLVSAGGVDGIVEGDVDGVVEGVVADGLIGAGEDVSSTFLPQAPSASSADSATAVAAGLNWTEFMRVFLFKMDGKRHKRSLNLPKQPTVADETQAYHLVGIFRRRRSSYYIGSGVGCTSPGSGGVDSG
jgi:hypothetical protein